MQIDRELLAEEVAVKVAELLKSRAPDDRPLLSIPEAARRLNISTKGAWNLVNRQEIATVVIGENRRLIEPAELDRYIAGRRG